MEYYLDIETTTDHKTIRLVGIKENLDNYYYFETKSQLEKFFSDFGKDDVLYTYNGEGFDYDVLKKVWELDLPDTLEKSGVKLVDLFIVSKMFDPDRKSHSLESYGEQFGLPKLEVDYDNADIHALAVYLKRDLELTQRVASLFNKEIPELMARAFSNGKKLELKHGLRVEQKVRRIMNEQRTRGIPFDTFSADILANNLQADMNFAETTAKPFMPVFDLPKSKIKNPPKVQFKKDGTLSAHMERYLEECNATYSSKAKRVYCNGVIYKMPLTEPLVTQEAISLKETNRLKDYLLSVGWTPAWWNVDSEGNRKSPQLIHRDTKEVDPTLHKYFDPIVIDCLVKYQTARSRLGTIGKEGQKTGWRNCVEGGVIHHDADTVGTPTARMRHKVVANVPRVSSPYGKEMRSLFIPFTGHAMVGWDASSLEAVMEAHYTYPFDKDYANELVSGDVHTRNMKALDLPDRDAAKKFKYMVTYGARPPKIASSMGVSLHQAERWYDNFWDNNMGLSMLMIHLKSEWEDLDKKYLIGLDGRPLSTRKEHALLNTKLQGAGAIVMKHALLIAERTIAEACPAAKALIRYHDEEQWSVPTAYADTVGKLGVESIEKAGKYLKLNVPLTGEYKTGFSWADTH